MRAYRWLIHDTVGHHLRRGIIRTVDICPARQTWYGSAMDDRTQPATEGRIAYRPAEVAKRLDVSRSHVYRLFERGQLRKVVLGGRWVVLAEDLDEFIETLKAGTAA